MRMRNVKRWLTSLLCVAMLFSTLSVFGAVPKAKAVSTYDGEAGAAWGRANYKGKYNYSCATFASQCLNAGGFTDVYDAGCTSLRRKLLATGVFVEYPLEVTKQKIYPHSSANNGKVSVGDVLLVHKRGSSTYVHAYVAETVNDGPLYVVQTSLGDVYGSRHCWFDYNGNTTDYEIVSMHYTGKTPEPDPNRDELGCTTAYAGWYQVTYRTGASVNSGHNKNWNSKVGEIPYGQYVYISKATGTGSGNLGHILYDGAERYIAMGLLTRMSGDPLGSVDSYGTDAGSVWLNGWAFDWDNCEEQLQINVYLDDNLVLQGKADGERSDVNGSYSWVVGSYHGFSLRANTNLSGSHKMDVYAINVGSGANKCIGSVWVDIPAADTTGPEISNVQVTNVTNTGYDVSCTVTDPSGVERVQFPTWTDANGQDDLLSDWGTNPKASGTRNGDTWIFHVNIADHNNEGGTYCTDIHAYDTHGNESGWNAPRVYVDTELPVISNVQVTNVTTEGYDVSCTVTDNVGVNRVQFPTWTDANGQDDLLSDWSINPKASGTRNGDTWTFHVSIADHNNERGKYITHIYAYDDAGNIQSNVNVASGVEVPVPNPTLTFDANGGTAEFDTKQAERGAAYGALPEAWMDGYVFDGWYTDAVGGSRVSSSTVYTAAGHTTLYAHWMPVASDAEQGWSLQDGTLIITSQGAMQDYTSARETPWFSDRADIRKIVVQNGVTSIGNYAFYGCENVTSVALPSTVTQIGKLAFYGCRNLSSLTLPDSLTMVEDYAFAKASGLGTIAFKGSAPLFGAGVFADVSAEVRYPAEDSTWTDAVRQSYTGNVSWAGVSEAELTVQTSDLQLNDPELEALLADSCV